MNTIIDVVSVKQNLMETPILHADTQGAVLSINQQQTRLPDDKLTRWLLRASLSDYCAVCTKCCCRRVHQVLLPPRFTPQKNIFAFFCWLSFG